ncbi:hypothetical protein T01_6282 [Trichinella spiralis]|uniref:Uncharacterized protein n=1 Tax=Trichinella spiralis TaxID=6334 RepID=A0A0V1B3G1_TRISP|nr:hypothetical protein T01_6282 [Trichinella spiralis]
MKEKRLHDGQHRLPGSTIVTVFIGFLLLLVGKKVGRPYRNCCGLKLLSAEATSTMTGQTDEMYA